MESNRDNILSKIQRCFALSSSPNENEAKAALATAQRLMIQYNVSMIEVDTFQDQDVIYEEADIFSGSSKLPLHIDPICTIINKFFFVKTLYNKNIERNRYNQIVSSTTKVTFFGTKDNIEIARYVFKYLSRTFLELYNQWGIINGKSITRAKSYYHGLMAGFYDKLQKERETQVIDTKNALVIVTDKLDKALEEKYENIKYRKQTDPKDWQAYVSGFRDGKNIEIAKAIQGNENKGLISEAQP